MADPPEHCIFKGCRSLLFGIVDNVQKAPQYHAGGLSAAPPGEPQCEVMNELLHIGVQLAAAAEDNGFVDDPAILELVCEKLNICCFSLPYRLNAVSFCTGSSRTAYSNIQRYKAPQKARRASKVCGSQPWM